MKVANIGGTDALPIKRFAVGLSFPGEQRSRVSSIAEILAVDLSRQRILYDKYHEAEFAVANLDPWQ